MAGDGHLTILLGRLPMAMERLRVAGCGFSRQEAEDELTLGSSSLGQFWPR